MATAHGTRRCATRDGWARLFRYVALTFLIPFSIGTMLIVSRLEQVISRFADVRSEKHHSVVGTLIVSPIVESLVMLVIWRMSSIVSGSSRPYAYWTIITALAFVTHGIGIEALLPSIMFTVSAVYFTRSRMAYDSSYASAFCGVLTIHVLYNLPSTILR